MLATIWAKIKAFFAWLYKWITVIVGVVVVAPTAIIDFLNTIQAIDWAPLISNEKALLIGAITAVAKAVIAAASAAYSAAAAKKAG